MPSQVLSVGDELRGFTVTRVTPLPEMFCIAYQLEHVKSGARLLHLHAEDNENLFSINFPTPPVNDTGLTHILEHAVLAGSQRFPVRDPFFEMLKMSMATFINALTGKDCTYYPVSSNVRADLFNLAEVYFDAVFHPLLTDDIFQREGHHLCPLDPAQPAGALAVNGIVYNEMKAAYANPESVLWRDTCRLTLPDTPYGFDSGGDPEHIPSLTYQQLVEFHRVHYHPSNARIVLYGDIETAAHLEFLAPRLDAFDRIDASPAFPPQPAWSAPLAASRTYDLSNESPANRTYLQLAWRVPGGLDAENSILLQVIARILFGDDGAPLKRALIDSKLGQDITNAGVLLNGAEGLFGVGLKGSEASRMNDFRSLVLDSLAKLCDDGIPPELIESAFRRYFYEVREIGELHPLRVAQEVIGPWVLGGDPLLYLQLEPQLPALQARCLAEPAILTSQIREHLLENPHRLDLTLAPDAEWKAKTDAAFKAKMSDLRASLSDTQAEAIAANAAALQAQAGTANSPEALASLPQLARHDLPHAPAFVDTATESLPSGVTFLRNDVFANGVNYLALRVDLAGLSADLWPFLPFYLEVVNKMGAAGHDYAAMARRVSASTGGLTCTAVFSPHAVDTDRTCKGIVFDLRALDDQLDAALDVLADKLRAPDPNDLERLADIARQSILAMQSSMVSMGHVAGLVQAQALMNEEGYLRELVGGLSYHRSLKLLEASFKSESELIVNSVLAIHKVVCNRRRLTACFTGGDAAADKTRSFLDALAQSLPEAEVIDAPSCFKPSGLVPRRGYAGPMQVAHCVQVMPAPHRSHADAPLLSLAMAMLRVDYMISELRFKGNAYGANCNYRSGLLALTTYADPHIKRTLEVFEALPEYVRSAAWGEEELTRGIIASSKVYVKPIRPRSANTLALAEHTDGVTRERVAERYDLLRSATPRKLKDALLAVLEPGFAQAPVVVLSNREKLEAANRELGARALQISELLG